MPSSRPKPDCLKPPNGVATRTDVFELIVSPQYSSTASIARRAGKAARAAATAASASSRPASSSSAIVFSVAGLRTASTSLLTVAAGLLDERPEEGKVLARLGMPENADGETAPGILERLDRAVLGARRFAQPVAEAPVALVVMALHRCAVAEDALDARAGNELDVVVGEDAGRVLVLLVPDHLGQVLDEIAAQRDVHDLAPATDGEDGHVAGKGRLEEHELGAVAVGADVLRLGVRVGAVAGGIEVGAAREEEAVEGVERLLRPAGARRHEQRPPAGALHGADVVERDERCGTLPHAPAGLLRIRGDSYDRPPTHVSGTPPAKEASERRRLRYRVQLRERGAASARILPPAGQPPGARAPARGTSGPASPAPRRGASRHRRARRPPARRRGRARPRSRAGGPSPAPVARRCPARARAGGRPYAARRRAP